MTAERSIIGVVLFVTSKVLFAYIRLGAIGISAFESRNHLEYLEELKSCSSQLQVFEGIRTPSHLHSAMWDKMWDKCSC